MQKENKSNPEKLAEMFGYKWGGQEQGGSSAGKDMLPSPYPSSPHPAVPLPSTLGARHCGWVLHLLTYSQLGPPQLARADDK